MLVPQELKAADIELAPLDHAGDANPVDAIWGANRPAPPLGPVRLHPLQFAGETVKDKIEKVGPERPRCVFTSVSRAVAETLDLAFYRPRATSIAKPLKRGESTLR